MEHSTRQETTIFRVPKLLLEPNLQFYTPTFVSIGSFHVKYSELHNMVNHKCVAFTRMGNRMDNIMGYGMDSTMTDFYNLINKITCYRPDLAVTLWTESYEGRAKDTLDGFRNIRHISKDLGNFYKGMVIFRNVYEDEIIALWFLVDTCFIFEFLLNYLRRIKEKKDYLKEWVVERPSDFIFDSWIQNPTWQGIVNDLLMLENQIPLSCFTLLGEMGQLRPQDSGVGAKESIIQMMWEFASLNHHGIFMWLPPRSPSPESSHLLDLFYKRIVGSNLKSYEEDGYPWEELQFFHYMPSWFKDPVGDCKDIFVRFFRQCSSSVRGFFPHSKPMDGEGLESPPALQIPSAVELSKMGVKFHVVRRPTRMNETPLRYIRFDEHRSTLYLPEVRVDRSAQTLLMNFIALEVTSAKYHPRPVTNFALFMDELINSEDDVGVLRRAGILKNLVSTDAELARNFNCLRTSLPFNEGFKVVDEARLGLQKFLKRRYKILWNEFLATYFSKPWLFLGAVGAVLLLVMTTLQVVCLFSNCNPLERKLYG